MNTFTRRPATPATIGKRDIVAYREPVGDEAELTFAVLEVRGDQVLMALIDPDVRPTTLCPIADLEVLDYGTIGGVQ